MLSISISFLLFELRLLRIFVFPGCIVSPSFEVAHHFLELFFCGSKQEHVVSKAHIREAVVIAIS